MRCTVSAALVLVLLGSVGVYAQDGFAPEPSGSCTVRGTTVLLSWGDYSSVMPSDPEPARNRIVIHRNGELLVVLGPDATGYVDQDVPRGLHAYEVTLYAGDLTLLLLRCEVAVDPYPGPHDLVCSVRCSPHLDPNDPDTGAARGCDVALAWNNGAQYQAVLIVRNGRCIALLPGDAQMWIDRNVPAGTHTYQVYGVVAALMSDPLQALLEEAVAGASEDAVAEALLLLCAERARMVRPATCTVTVPHVGPGPGPRDLVCLVIEVERWSQVPELAGVAAASLPPLPFRGVLLMWRNGAAYESIVVARNNQPIATLPGDAWYYLDARVPAGAHVYTVAGVMSGGVTRPASCRVEVPGPQIPPPPAGLTCRALCPIREPITLEHCEDCANCPVPCVVVMQWRNPCAYDAITVFRNGEAIQRLPGDATSFIDRSPPTGANAYGLVGMRGGISSPMAICRVYVPPRPPVAAPRELVCRVACTEPQPNAANISRCWVHMKWDNGQDYDAVLISRNGEALAKLPGDATEYVDEGVPHGRYVYAVTGVVGNAMSRPARCAVAVPEPQLTPPADLVCLTNVGPDPAAFLEAAESPEGDGSFMPVVRNAVYLRWRNTSRYDAILIRRNAELLARLPGDRTGYVDVRVVPGEYVYAVSAVRGDVETAPVRCRVTVGDPVPPPENLTCVLLSVERDATGESDITGPAVALAWENPVRYDALLLFRNGALIQRLPGGTQRTVDRGLLPGVCVYSLVGVLGGSQSVPAVCRIEIPGPVPPPQGLACDVVPVDCLVSPDCPPGAVRLTWRNPVRYARILIARNGRRLVDLPGDRQEYLDRAVQAGAEYVYEVWGITWAGEESDAARCRVTVPPDPPAPPHNLVCEPSEGIVKLSWTNGQRYAAVVIERNGALLAELPGTAEAYADEDVAPGRYRYAVYGVVPDGTHTAPARCHVLVPGPSLENVLYFARMTADGASVLPAGAAVCLADHKDPLEGWSFGVCSDPAQIVPTDATIEDTFTAELNGGAGPGFLAIGITDAGVTMAAIVQQFGNAAPGTVFPPAIEPGAGRTLLRLAYDAAPSTASQVAPRDGMYRIMYCGRLGSPPVPVIYVVDGFDVRPATVEGVVRIPPPQAIRFIRGDANADGAVDIGDVVAVLEYLFGGKGAPPCLAAADANNSLEVNIADAVYLLNYLFGGASPPPPPFPDCGLLPDDTARRLPCNSFPPCE